MKKNIESLQGIQSQVRKLLVSSVKLEERATEQRQALQRIQNLVYYAIMGQREENKKAKKLAKKAKPIAGREIEGVIKQSNENPVRLTMSMEMKTVLRAVNAPNMSAAPKVLAHYKDKRKKWVRVKLVLREDIGTTTANRIKLNIQNAVRASSIMSYNADDIRLTVHNIVKDRSWKRPYICVYFPFNKK